MRCASEPKPSPFLALPSLPKHLAEPLTSPPIAHRSRRTCGQAARPRHGGQWRPSAPRGRRRGIARGCRGRFLVSSRGASPPVSAARAVPLRAPMAARPRETAAQLRPAHVLTFCARRRRCRGPAWLCFIDAIDWRSANGSCTKKSCAVNIFFTRSGGVMGAHERCAALPMLCRACCIFFGLQK